MTVSRVLWLGQLEARKREAEEPRGSHEKGIIMSEFENGQAVGNESELGFENQPAGCRVVPKDELLSLLGAKCSGGKQTPDTLEAEHLAAMQLEREIRERAADAAVRALINEDGSCKLAEEELEHLEEIVRNGIYISMMLPIFIDKSWKGSIEKLAKMMDVFYEDTRWCRNESKGNDAICPALVLSDALRQHL